MVFRKLSAAEQRKALIAEAKADERVRAAHNAGIAQGRTIERNEVERVREMTALRILIASMKNCPIPDEVLLIAAIEDQNASHRHIVGFPIAELKRAMRCADRLLRGGIT